MVRLLDIKIEKGKVIKKYQTISKPRLEGEYLDPLWIAAQALGSHNHTTTLDTLQLM